MTTNSYRHSATRASVRQPTHLAWLAASISCGCVGLAQAQTADLRGVEEVIVTAQKRSERLQDVPVPVTALDASTLAETHQLQIREYYTKIPGLSLTLLGDASSPSASIRGVSTGGATNPTVGTVVDDVAFSTSTLTGAGHWVPDFDPSELARIEVLRGPQGTLYGASSLGGLLKFVTVDPSTDEFAGRLELGTTTVSKSDDLGYSVRGSVNVPLGDTFAMRASGSTRREGGYIDDPSQGREDVNRTDVDTGRLAALWQPSQAFSLKLSALVQDTTRDGENYAFRLPGLDDLEHRALRNTGHYEANLEAYSATATAELGRSELISLTGYSISETLTAIDASLNATLSGRTLTNFGVTGITNPQLLITKKFAQEVRLSTPLGERVDWLLGGFYTRESYLSHSDIYAVDPATANRVGTWFHARRPSEFEEAAAFTNFTFKLTDRIDVQVGGRQSELQFATGGAQTSGLWNVIQLRNTTIDVITPEFESKDTAFTYLLTPRFKITPDMMVYARLASGYRPGGPNTSAAARSLGLPVEYGPDTTENYEVGMKGQILQGRLSFDASLYHIDWEDIQIQLRDQATLLVYFTNAGRARSRGAELSFDVRPLQGMTIAAWGAWTDAELTEVPSTSLLTARVGDRLPYSSRFSGHLSIYQEFPIGRVTAFVGAAMSYVGDRQGAFFVQAVQQRETFPSYTQVDVRAGARFDTWTINAFVNNAADERGVLSGGRDAIFSLPYIVTYIQPRTVGLSVTKAF